MKKLTIILTVLILVIISSCSEEFLTKTPQGSTSENVFYSEKGIDALLTGTYGMVKGSALWTVSWGASIQNWTYGSVASDDAYKGSEITDQVPVNEIERWEVTTTNAYPAEKWRLCLGMGVDRANKTLRVIQTTLDAGTITQAVADKYKAEVRFLRGVFYFEAWLVFGDYIPLIDETVVDPASISNENPADAVLNFILADLNYAAGILPHRQTGQPGRPTKWAAKAVAARALLQSLKYAEAKVLLQDIITNGGFSLMPNFIDNFNIATENNSESIFEIQANVNDINESLNAEMGIGLNWPHGGDIGMCCGFHQPSQNLVNAYKVDNVTGLPLFTTFNNTDLKNDQGVPSASVFVPTTDPVDPRLDWTVSRRGIPYKDWGVNRGMDWMRKQSEGGPYLPVAKTFFNKSERNTLSTTTGWQTGINANNYRYIRYSHILLWRAEVAAFENDFATARTYVNQIRDRADNKLVMGKVNVTSLPPTFYPFGAAGDVDFTLPAANYQIGQYSVADMDTQAEAMRAVQWEQRLEFATEGRRFFDLRRWDKLTGGMRVDMVATLNAFQQADLRIRPFMNGASFSTKDMYMPVPQSQLDLQVGVLVQNPDYR